MKLIYCSTTHNRHLDNAPSRSFQQMVLALFLKNQLLLNSRLFFSRFLKLFSSFFAVLGGVLLASKIETSGNGFIFLTMNSSQMLLASILRGDKSTICYSGSIFIFVDCLGIYRWLLD